MLVWNPHVPYQPGLQRYNLSPWEPVREVGMHAQWKKAAVAFCNSLSILLKVQNCHQKGAAICRLAQGTSGAVRAVRYVPVASRFRFCRVGLQAWAMSAVTLAGSLQLALRATRLSTNHCPQGVCKSMQSLHGHILACMPCSWPSCTWLPVFCSQRSSFRPTCNMPQFEIPRAIR